MAKHMHTDLQRPLARVEPRLKVSELHAGYGNIPILFGLDFHVAPGELLGIMGHNGMGKTTLLRALMGHLPATAGTISLDGVDITSMKPEHRARQGLGLVPQGRQIFASLSVLDNLRIGAVHLPRRAAQQKVEAIIEELPRLKPILARTGGVLSGGEQQILALGRCLCAEPKLILLDEPTEGIQPSIVEEIAEFLRRLAGQGELSIILVEQDLAFISQLATRVLTLRKGELDNSVGPDALWAPTNVADLTGLDQ